MATGVVRNPSKPTQLYILVWLTYPENLVKIHTSVWAVEHPQMLKSKNIQSIAMATVVARYPQNLISAGSSYGKHTLKIW